MIDRNEIVLSTHDAATLSAVLATCSVYEAPAPGAADELIEVLAGAKVVAPHALDRDIVTLDSEVTYIELPRGRSRTVELVHPASADASSARISVFAPVGRALLGRRAGSCVPVALPDTTIDALQVIAARAEAVMTPRVIERVQARTAFRRSTSMLHPECPIEQALHSADPSVQAQLLQEIWRRRSFLEEGALLVAEPKRLRVLARSEGALRRPVDALRESYGDALVVELPSVRYALGAPVLEPWMMVLVTGPSRHLPSLQADLGRRRAIVARLDYRADPFVLEAEAPLGQLLGYGDWLDERIDGDVDVSMWLSRYRALDDDGPHAA